MGINFDILRQQMGNQAKRSPTDAQKRIAVDAAKQTEGIAPVAPAVWIPGLRSAKPSEPAAWQSNRTVSSGATENWGNRGGKGNWSPSAIQRQWEYAPRR